MSLLPGVRPQSRTGFSTKPIPAVLIMIPSSAPFSTTFVSPVTIAASTSWVASSIDATILRKSLIENPSSITIALVRASGAAPIIARSLTVPETESRPISPPGKKIGLTTCVSVVKTRNPPCASGMAAPSSNDSKPMPPAFLFLIFVKTSAIRSFIISPPAPWRRLTFLSIVVRSMRMIQSPHRLALVFEFDLKILNTNVPARKQLVKAATLGTDIILIAQRALKAAFALGNRWKRFDFHLGALKGAAFRDNFKGELELLRVNHRELPHFDGNRDKSFHRPAFDRFLHNVDDAGRNTKLMHFPARALPTL